MAAALSVLVCGALHAQTLTVSPPRALIDELVFIRAAGLQPNEHIAISATLIDGGDHRWFSQAEFVADAQGQVDVSQQAPVKGSYKETSAMGLIWSMRPDDGTAEMYLPPKKLAPQEIDFHLLRDIKEVASAHFEQWSIGIGVSRIPLEGKLHGILFVPPGNGPHPGMLVLGGSEGGPSREKARWLASRGYAALALAYFHYEDLPANLEGIPLEYFGAALDWMKQRPEILSTEIGVMGMSRGGELALQLASMYPQIKFVVAYVPANVRYPACCGRETQLPYAWTWEGQPLTFVPLQALRDPAAAVRSRARIAVENTHGPILLIAGEDDGVWDSAGMSDAIVKRLQSAHFAFPVEELKYPHAGHLAGNPAFVPTWHTPVFQPQSNRPMTFGGSPEGDAQSTLDAIPKVLAFLRESLAPQPASPATPQVH